MPHPILLHFTRADRASDSFGFQPGPARYQAHRPGGGVAEVVLDWDDELLELLARAAAPRPNAGMLSRLGERLRPLVANTALSPLELALAAGEPAHITLRSAAAELYALPWELLALGPGGLWLGQLEGVSLNLEWPETRTAPEAPRTAPEAQGQHSGAVLLAWSDAGGPVPWVAHRDAIAAASGGIGCFQPDRDVLAAASRASIADRLRVAQEQGRPYTALHLLCHGAATGDGGVLVLDAPSRAESSDHLDGAALRGLLHPHLGSLRLVTLMACSAAAHGKPGSSLGGAALALHRAGCEAVIASRHPLAVESSILASEALYRGLLDEHVGVQEALLRARRALIDRSTDSAWAHLQLFARAADGRDTRPFVPRPYRGLLAFEQQDARFYFGRERERDALIGRILAASRGELPRFQLLVGATGVGKTSLLRAAVLPALARQGWMSAAIRPTRAGLDALERRRAGLGADEHVLVVVDPLQDLFLSTQDTVERDLVARAIWEASQDARVVVLACLRVDALGRCEEVTLEPSGLRLDAVAYDDAHRYFLPAATPRQLREAIERPAGRVGLQFEPGLVELLLEDAGQAAGALPALQHVLDQLWTRREGRMLTHAAYRALGGLAGALARTADDLIEDLVDVERSVARRLLVSLVCEGPDGALAGRRNVAVADTRPHDPLHRTAFDRVLEALVQRRLLTVSQARDRTDHEGVVEIAHEALLRRWENLRAWYNEDRDLHRRLDEIRQLAESWAAHRAQSGYLIDGNRLAYALELAREHGAGLPRGVPEFLAACQDNEVLALARERAQAERMHDAAILATARAARSLDPTRAALLLREVRGADQSPGWHQEAVDVLNLPLCVEQRQVEPAKGAPLERASPTGARFAGLSASGAVRVWGAEGEQPATLRGHVGPVLDLAWSPDGRTLATAGEDQSVRLWRPPDPSPLRSLPNHTGAVTGVCFDPSGRRLLSVCQDGIARVWEIDDLRRMTPIAVGAPLTAACWLDADRLVVGAHDGGLRVLNVSGAVLHTLTAHAAPIVALEADGVGGLRSRSADGLDRRWRLAPAAREGPPRTQRISEGRLVVMAWSPRGETLALGAGDEPPVLWHLDGDAPPLPLAAHRGTARALAFSPDGGHVLGGASDGVARIWSALDGACIAELRGHDVPLRSAIWSPDGGRIATLDADGELRLWDGRGLELCQIAHADSDTARVAFSPDSARLLGWSPRTISVWSVLGEPREERWPSVGGPVKAARWRPDGAALGVVLTDGSLHVVTPDDVSALGRLEGALPRLAEWALAWRPDGAALAVGDGAGAVTLWGTGGQGAIWSGRTGGGQVLSLEFDTEGRRLLARAAGRLVVFDGASPDEPLALRSGGVGAVQAGFDPRGQRVAAIGEDGQARLWPVRTEGLLALLRAATALELSAADQELYRGATSSRGLWGAAQGVRSAP